MKKWTLTVAAAALATAAPVAAWNGRGHMIVAAKAWQHLTPQSRTAIGRLLRHNPAFDDWTRGVAEGDQDRVAFIQAATWPDDIKNDNFQDPMRRHTNGYTNGSAGDDPRRNTGYDDCTRHRQWHFTNRAFSPDGTPVRPGREPNIETQINAFRAVLADRAAGDELKAYDLVWLIHLVGDVHQPLHATARFISSDRNGDGGGNDVMVCLSAAHTCGAGGALHGFWDDALGKNENVDSVTQFARQLPAPPAAMAAIAVPSRWIDDSFNLARSDVYRAPIGIGLGVFRLTTAYEQNAATVATRRVSLAGVRLANLINAADLHVRGDPVRQHTCPA